MKTKYFVKVLYAPVETHEFQLVAIFKRRNSRGGYAMVYISDMYVYEEMHCPTHEWATLLGARWLSQGFDRKVLVNFNFDFEPNARFVLVDFNNCDMKHIVVKEEK